MIGKYMILNIIISTVYTAAIYRRQNTDWNRERLHGKFNLKAHGCILF